MGLKEMKDGVGAGVGIEDVAAGARIYLLDEAMEPVGEGMVGEVYVGGESVGSGYWGRSVRTAERYVPDRWSGKEGGRLYRTGDLWRRRRDGRVEFCGRRDGRVEVEGRRVETGEIEAHVKEYAGVKEAVVTAGWGRGIEAWVVCEEGAKLASTELQEYLRERLRRGWCRSG